MQCIPAFFVNSVMIIPERHITQRNDAFSSYWKTDKDSLLSRLLPTKPDLRESAQWVPLYFESDTLGDKVALKYMSQGFSKGLELLLKDFHAYPANKAQLDDDTDTLFRKFTEVPEWVDFDLINHGAHYCKRCGTSSLSVLRNYCLMGGYESSAINKPLIFTEALKKGAVKRLSDTVDFWMHVTETDGLKPHHPGIMSILVTRMIHSYSRIMIERNVEWKTTLWGRPLNMWDMVATNLGFSIAFMDGLSKLNFPPAPSEIKGTLHLWKYVGYLLGIPVRYLPDTPENAAQSLYLWSRTQKGSDNDSISLAMALYEEPRKVNFTKNTFMKWFVQKTNLGYNEVLLGPESLKSLNLPASKAKYWILFLNLLNKIADNRSKKDSTSYRKMVERGRKAQNNVWKLYKSEK